MYMHTLQINQLGTDALKHQRETIFVVVSASTAPHMCSSYLWNSCPVIIITLCDVT